MAAFGAIFGSDVRDTGRGRHVSGGRVAAGIAAQHSDSFQEYPPVTDRTNADFLQVFLRETREDPLVYLVVAERRLVSFEAQAPQPNQDVHGGAPPQAHLNIKAKPCPAPRA